LKVKGVTDDVNVDYPCTIYVLNGNIEGMGGIPHAAINRVEGWRIIAKHGIFDNFYRMALGDKDEDDDAICMGLLRTIYGLINQVSDTDGSAQLITGGHSML
jgi:hypothetical protein